MNKVAVIYWSGTGNTEAMAQLVLEGVQNSGGEGELFAAGSFDLSQAGEYTAFALGCPAMGAEQLEESEFEPLYQSLRGRLSGKPVGLFGSYGWGDGEWMRLWQEDLDETGARRVQEGVMACGAPDGDSAEACSSLGQALAQG